MDNFKGILPLNLFFTVLLLIELLMASKIALATLPRSDFFWIEKFTFDFISETLFAIFNRQIDWYTVHLPDFSFQFQVLDYGVGIIINFVNNEN